MILLGWILNTMMFTLVFSSSDSSGLEVSIASSKASGVSSILLWSTIMLLEILLPSTLSELLWVFEKSSLVVGGCCGGGGDKDEEEEDEDEDEISSSNSSSAVVSEQLFDLLLVALRGGVKDEYSVFWNYKSTISNRRKKMFGLKNN